MLSSCHHRILHVAPALLFALVIACGAISIAQDNSDKHEAARSSTPPTEAGSETTEQSETPERPGITKRTGRAQQSGATDQPDLSYRRVFVPADRTDLWPSEGKRFLPIQPDEFNQLLESARRVRSLAPRVRIDHAIYQASLLDDSRLDGKARLSVSHAGAKTAVLSLEDCSLIIQRATWEATGNEATLGLTAKAGAGLLVDRSGQLSLDWSARAEPDSLPEETFRLRFPSSASKTLELTLPRGKAPAVAHGVILGPYEQDGTLALWKIEIGGRDEIVLRLRELDNSIEPFAPASFTERIHYSLIARRLDMSHELTLNPLLGAHVSGSTRFVDLLLDDPLVLVSARSGNTELDWSHPANKASTENVEPRDAKPEGASRKTDDQENAPRSRRIRIEFPWPIEAGQRLTLKAVAPMTSNQSWDLPNIRLHKLLWTSGAVTLDLPDSLVLDQLNTHACRQTSTSNESGPSHSVRRQFQKMASDGSVTIEVSDQIDSSTAVAFAGVQQHTAATFELGANEVSGQLGVAIESLDRRLFDLQGQVASNWTIDSVETIPSSALAEWMLDEEVSKGRRLTIRLAQPITPGRPLRLFIRGSLRHSQVTSSDQSFVEFDYKHASRSLVLARPRSNSGRNPSRVEVNATQQPIRINPKSLTAVEQALLENPDEGLLFERKRTIQDLTLVLANTRPRFAGQIMIDSLVEESSYTQTTTFRCTPQSGSVTSLLVQFAKSPRDLRGAAYDTKAAPGAREAASGKALESAGFTKPTQDAPRNSFADAKREWRFFDSKKRPLIARKLTAQERRPLRLLGEGELWEVSLRQPYDSEFAINATKTVPRRAVHPIAFAALPNATRQSGEVAIHAKNLGGIRLENARLAPLPAPSVKSRGGQILGLFQFDPLRETLAAASSPLTIHTASDPMASPSLIVWRRESTARFAPSGVVDCFLSLEIENQGESHLAVNLPTAGRLTNLWRDGQRLTLPSKDPTTGKLILPLAQDRRFTTIAIFFTVRQSPLFSFGVTTLPTVEIEAPVVEQELIAIFPPSYETHSTLATAHTVLSPWNERLFGPLSRSAASRRFDPFRPGDWLPSTETLVASLPDSTIDQKRLREYSGQVLSVFASADDSMGRSPDTWGNLIHQCVALQGTNSTSDSIPGLFIDRAALTALGIGPQNAVHRGSALSPGADDLATAGSQQLKGADLVLWTFPKGALLTTAARTALHRSMLTPTGYSSVFEVLAPTFSEALTRASEKAGSVDRLDKTPILRADQWIAKDSDLSSPWQSISAMPLHPPGWNAYRIQPHGKGKPNTIRVLHTGTVRLLGALAFLLASGLAAGKLCENLRAYLLVLAVVSLASLLLPVSLVPILAGLVLGILIGPILRLAYNHFVRPRLQRVIISKGSTIISPATALFLCALFCFDSLSTATAQSVEENQTPVRQPLPQILIPFDAQSFEESDTPPTFLPGATRFQPSGDDIYVPEPFFRQLHQEVNRANQSHGLWIITRANYRARFVESQPSTPMVLDQFETVFLVKTFGRGVRVEIPFSSANAKWLGSSVQLDGRPVQWRPSEDGKLVRLLIEEPGAHRVTLTPKLASEKTEEGAKVQISVPRLPSAFIELIGPKNAPPVSVSGEDFELREKDASGQEPLPIRPNGSMRLAWAARESAAPKAPLAVDEMLWMRVGAATTRLSARFQVQAAKKRTSPFLLEADAGWRILAPARGSNIQHITPLPDSAASDSAQRYRIETAHDPQGEVSFEIHFVQTQKDRVSVFDAPRVRLLGASPRKRLLAFTIDSSLQYDAPASVEEGSILPSVFLKSWQAAAPSGARPETLAPTGAYRIVESMPTWNLVTAPLKSFIKYTDKTELTLGRRSATLNYTATFATGGAPRFQIQLACPESVAIESLTIRDSDSEIGSHWKRDSRGRINVFLDRPLTTDAQLRLLAAVSVPADGQLRTPMLDLPGCQRTKRQLTVYRKPDALVSVEAPQSSKSLSPSENKSSSPGRGSLVEAIELPKTKAEVICRIRPNIPRVQGRQIIRLKRSSSGWTASSELSLEIEDGVLDSIQFEVPDWWTGPFEVSPAASVQVLDLGESNASHSEEPGTRRLLIQPEEAFHGSVTVEMEAPLALKDAQPAQAPNIRLLDYPMKQRFVALSKRGTSGELSWNTRGLRAVSDSLGDSFGVSREEIDTAQYDLFEVTIPDFRASPRTVENLNLAPVVTLVDLHVLLNHDFETRTVATFDLDPGGLGTCELRLPEGYDLLRVAVEGVPCAAIRLSDGQSDNRSTSWQIALGPRGLPQRIEVIYVNGKSPNAIVKPNELIAPQLLASAVAITVQHTLWSLYSDTPLRAASSDSAKEAPLPDAQAIRQQAILSMLSTGVERCERFSIPQRANWYRGWTRRLGEPSIDQTVSTAEDVSESTKEQLRSLSAQLGIEGELDSVSVRANGTSPVEIVEPRVLLASAYRGLLPCNQYIYAGRGERLTVSFTDAHSSNLWTRIFVATIILLVSSLAYFVTRRPIDINSFRSAKYIWFIAIGLTWWLWMAPSVLGIVILLVTAVTFAWRNGREVAESCTDWFRRHVLRRGV